MTYRLVSACVLVACLAWSCPQVVGQSAEPTVEGTGTAAIDLQPQVLRLQLKIMAAGKDIQQALSSLQARQDKIRAKLVELGASEASIKFSHMNVSSNQEDRQRKMQRMIMQRMHGGGGMPAASQPVASPTQVTITVKAEWPLKAAEPSQALALAEGLQQKIKAEDLAGKKDLEKLSAADQESLEESAEGQMAMSEMNPDENDGAPTIFYVCKVSKKDEAAAMAQAFAKAQSQAEQMAAAAGMKVGPIRQLRSNPETSAFNRLMEFGGMSGGPYGYRMMQQLEQARSEPGEQPEALAMEPGALKFPAIVSVTFALVKP